MSSVTTTPRPGDGQVITLHGEGELVARAGHLFDARQELICAAVDMHTWVVTNRKPERGLAAMAEHVAAGLEVRKMYNAAALADPADADHLRAIVRTGARVRISPTAIAHETIMIDRKVAILAGPPVAGVRDFSIIMAPKAVEAVRSLFLATWAGAIELADFAPATPVVDDQGREILRLLSGGQKDEAAARSLGISVRTYRRRVADLMALLGAESRFQAGARARALGLRW